MKILFAASEVYPLVKTGGLADVACFLPTALKEMDCDVRIILPAYRSILEQRHAVLNALELDLPWHEGPSRLLEIELPDFGVPVYLVDIPQLYDREGAPYQDNEGNDWPDNLLRFTLFCRVIYQISLGLTNLGWAPDILHANDWHTGLAVALLSEHKVRPAMVFTVHNLAYQGLFPLTACQDMDLPDFIASPSSMEFHGQLSFIKGGLAHADKITTVSPRYAQEITTPEYGLGLDGLLKYRSKHLSGILNGVNYQVWDPRYDSYICSNYWVDTLTAKRPNKIFLQTELGLMIGEDYIICAFIGRIAEQKGSDLLIANLDTILGDPRVQLVMLGKGNPGDETQLLQTAAHYPGRVSVSLAYSEPTAHFIQAGADILLMPSRFEPCGLSQLYALRYGTLPVVSMTGGLMDTVIDANKTTLKNHTATGFQFPLDSAVQFKSCILGALNLYRDSPSSWKKIMLNAMQQEFSWQESAGRYVQIYNEIVNRMSAEEIHN